MLHREPETETKRERAGERERDPARERRRQRQRDPGKSQRFSGSLWLPLALFESLWLVLTLSDSLWLSISGFAQKAIAGLTGSLLSSEHCSCAPELYPGLLLTSESFTFNPSIHQDALVGWSNMDQLWDASLCPHLCHVIALSK